MNGVKGMKKVRINPISDKQKEKNKQWKAITDRKVKDLNNICQWCGRFGWLLDGHHIIKRRYGIDTYENCYICHRLCHGFIEDNNVDVRIYKSKEEYEDYLISLWG